MSRRRRLRVLLVAHHANPEMTSEPLIGWNWARELDRRCDVTLVTHVRNRSAIERAGFEGRIHAVDTERLAATVNRINDRLWGPFALLNRSILESLPLFAFDREATRLARRLAEAGEIDLVHRVSPISPRVPTRLGTAGVPFLLGPINGGLSTAPGFGEIDRRERSWAQSLRPLARLIDPRDLTFGLADGIWCANETTRSVVPERHHGRVELVCENAVATSRFIPAHERSGECLRILYLGRLIPCKAVDRLVKAIGLLPEEIPVRLDIVGRGPEEPALREQIRDDRLEARVRILDWVAQEHVPRVMADCDVFCLPSIRESGGAVVLEAMASGKPVIVADHGGPATTVTPEVGIRVPTAPADEFSARIAGAISKLARDESLRRSMGIAARRLVESDHTWDARAELALRTYRSLTVRRRSETSAALAPRPREAA